EALEIPAGGTVVLKPGSDHVMLMGLKAPLKKGTRFELSLTFDKSGTVVIPVQVQKAGARSYKATE
ncbi:MAG: copper chaperone PCu(A)C, partial [Rhodospirillaceae bacterium]|nr:copper chaperone PCu(A)C [Rhodospirillaceae bacterium]